MLAMMGQWGCEKLLQSLTQVFEKMPCICSLDRLGSSESSSLCRDIASITANDLNGRISLEPSPNRSRIPIRQQVNRAMPFKVTDEGAVPMPLVPCPVIQTDHTRRLDRIIGETAQQTHKRIRARAHPQYLRETCCCFSPKRKAKMLQELFEPEGPP